MLKDDKSDIEDEKNLLKKKIFERTKCVPDWWIFYVHLIISIHITTCNAIVKYSISLNESILVRKISISRERLSCVQKFFFSVNSCHLQYHSYLPSTLSLFIFLPSIIFCNCVKYSIRRIDLESKHYSRNLDRTEKASQTSPNQCKCNISQFHQFKYHYCHVHKLFKTK